MPGTRAGNARLREVDRLVDRHGRRAAHWLDPSLEHGGAHVAARRDEIDRGRDLLREGEIDAGEVHQHEDHQRPDADRAVQLAVQAQALGLAANHEGLLPLGGPGPPEIEAGAAQHEHGYAQPTDDLTAHAAGDEDVAVQVVEEAYPARHRLLRFENLQRHRIDQDLKAGGERASRRHAALRRLARLRVARRTRLAAAELRPLVGHARTRQAHRGGLAHLDRPAHRDGNPPGLGVGCLGGLDQPPSRLPLAFGLHGRLALPQQVLDVVGIDQHRAGDAHHHQRQQQDEADPEMDLLQPVAERAPLRLQALRHGYPPPNATAIR